MLELTENPKVVWYGMPIFLLMIAVEVITIWKRERELYDIKDSFSNAGMGIGAMILGAAAKIWSIFLLLLMFDVGMEFRVEYFGMESFGWSWGIWILAVFADDFNFYWHHRFSHTVRVLWAAHIVHHSSEKYNLSVGLRNGWVTLFYKPLWWVWMPFIGFEPIMILTVMALNSIYQFGLHTQKIPSLGLLEKVFNTPWVHQVHHSCNVEYLDKNHGGLFIIWDKMFGTFRDNKGDIDTTFGVLKGPDSHNPLVIFSHEYQNIWRDVKNSKNLKEAFMYVFGPPGWSPTNATKTVKQMQRELALNGKVDDPSLHARFGNPNGQKPKLEPEPVEA